MISNTIINQASHHAIHQAIHPALKKEILGENINLLYLLEAFYYYVKSIVYNVQKSQIKLYQENGTHFKLFYSDENQITIRVYFSVNMLNLKISIKNSKKITKITFPEKLLDRISMNKQVYIYIEYAIKDEIKEHEVCKFDFDGLKLINIASLIIMNFAIPNLETCGIENITKRTKFFTNVPQLKQFKFI